MCHAFTQAPVQFRRVVQVQAVLLLSWVAGVAAADTCLAPTRPSVPSDDQSARAYASLIRQDFETYISDIEGYFRCLDAERARAFEEAREVIEAYGRFLRTVVE